MARKDLVTINSVEDTTRAFCTSVHFMTDDILTIRDRLQLVKEYVDKFLTETYDQDKVEYWFDEMSLEDLESMDHPIATERLIGRLKLIVETKEPDEELETYIYILCKRYGVITETEYSI